MAVSSIYGIERAMNQLWHNHSYHKPAQCDHTVVQYAKIGFHFNATHWWPFLWRHKHYFIAIKMAAQTCELWKIILWPPLYKILDPPLIFLYKHTYVTVHTQPWSATQVWHHKAWNGNVYPSSFYPLQTIMLAWVGMMWLHWMVICVHLSVCWSANVCMPIE